MELFYHNHAMVISYRENMVILSLDNVSVFLMGDVVRLKGLKDNKEFSAIFKLSEVYVEGYDD